MAVDLFASAGYTARLVQAGGHVLAEIYYEDDWHYFDADFSPFGETIYIKGVIPSMVELSRNPELIDAAGSEWIVPSSFYFPSDFYYLLLDEKNQSASNNYMLSTEYPSYYYFGEDAYGGRESVLYYQKTANDWQCLNEYYGWNYYDTIVDVDRELSELPMRKIPTVVWYEDVQISPESKSAHIEWIPAFDSDDDLAGYLVSIGSQSRGWDWGGFTGSEAAERYRSGDGYEPEMAQYMDDPLPADVAKIWLPADATGVDIPLFGKEPVYVSVIAFDEYGERAFRQGTLSLPPSSELRLAG